MAAQPAGRDLSPTGERLQAYVTVTRSLHSVDANRNHVRSDTSETQVRKPLLTKTSG